jgi:hypothetical protein
MEHDQFHLWNILNLRNATLFKGGTCRHRPRWKHWADRVEWLESQNQPVKTNVVA